MSPTFLIMWQRTVPKNFGLDAPIVLQCWSKHPHHNFHERDGVFVMLLFVYLDFREIRFLLRIRNMPTSQLTRQKGIRFNCKMPASRDPFSLTFPRFSFFLGSCKSGRCSFPFIFSSDFLFLSAQIKTVTPSRDCLFGET